MQITDAELADLYQRYSGLLYQRCLSILRNAEAAQDAVHETFARVIRNAESFRQESSPLTWMYRISTNYCLNQLRNAKTRQGKLDDHQEEIAGPGFTLPDAGAGHDQAQMLALLAEADEETQRCVIYTYYDDCTRDEVAKLVGLSVPTVRKRVNTFLDRARAVLGAAAVLILQFLPLAWSAS